VDQGSFPAGPGILSSLLPITLLAAFMAFPLGPPVLAIPAAPRLEKCSHPPCEPTCWSRRRRESSKRSQQISPVAFPPHPTTATARPCLCKSLALISNRNRELFIQRRWRAGNGGKGLNTAQACPPRGGQPRCHPGVPRVPWGAEP